MSGNGDKKKRGRPIGFKLSEKSKQAISKSKTGQSHRQETKDKISKSLILYFRRLNPLSEEIENTYCRLNDDSMCGWLNQVREELDDLDDVLTNRSMRSARRMEISFGNNIEYFGHVLTPETLLLFKEFCEMHGLDPETLFDDLT